MSRGDEQAVRLRVPGVPDISGIFSVLASYHFHPLGRAASADPDLPGNALLTVRNGIVDVDLATEALVAESDGEVVGFCCWGWKDRAAREAKTVLIAVAPSARGSGVGARLQAARQDAMWAMGAAAVHTWSDDPAAIRWYQSHFGYRAVGTEPLRHSIHRFRLEAEVWWGLHRGFPDRDCLTHLVLARPPARGQTRSAS